MSPLRFRDAKREDGFTLIELLVVVIIIGILAAIAIPIFLQQRQRAWRSELQSDLRNAAIAMETYYTDTASYGANALDAQYGFTNSPNTSLTVSVTGDAWCLSGGHDELTGVTWSLRPGGILAESGC